MSPQQLVEENMRLVYFVVHRYYTHLAKDEDIVQVGMLALCNAANNFDESKSQFANYAICCIRNAINLELRKRRKHYNMLSLEYDVVDENGEPDNFGNFLVGEEDVLYLDLDGFYNQLDPVEKEIYRLRQEGMSVIDIASEFGCSRDAIYQRMRKMKSKWRTTNGD